MSFQTRYIQQVLLFLSLTLLLQTSLQAQGVGINETNSTPDPSAMLDVQSTTKGLLIPRMTTTERTAISTPATGLMVFDNTTLSFWYYDGTAWTEIGGATVASPFNLNGNVVVPNATLVDESSTDFVFGSPQLDSDGNASHNKRMLFDKSKAAFRAGYVTGTEWDVSNLGLYSNAWGYNTKASQEGTTVWGAETEATGYYSTAWGVQSQATGDESTVWGRGNKASGKHATVWGRFNEAPSYNETALGNYSTTYTPNSSTTWDASDRLFVIGNGTSSSNRSNALTIYKDGTININDAYSLPITDGTAGQVVTTDGAGMLSWSTVNFTDTDDQTLTLTGNDLTIDNGNTVSLAGLEDNLGNHIATSNLQTAGHYLSNDGDNEGVYVATDGAVGIGTNAPNYPLDVQAGGANMRVGSAQLGAWPNNTGFAYFAHEDLNNGINGNYALLQNSSGRTFLNAASGWDIRFRINNTDQMILDAAGNVGIGTSTPTEKLHVNGSVRIQDGNQQNGYVLTSDADGVGTWTDPCAIPQK